MFASHPHTVGPARRSSGNACGVAFSLTSGTTVEQTDYQQTPTPPTVRWLRKQEGEEMAVARTPRKLVMGLVWVACVVLLDVNATELWPMPPHYIEVLVT